MRGLIGRFERRLNFDRNAEIAEDVQRGYPEKMERIYGVVSWSFGIPTAAMVVASIGETAQVRHENQMVEAIADFAINRGGPLAIAAVCGWTTIEALSLRRNAQEVRTSLQANAG